MFSKANLFTVLIFYILYTVYGYSDCGSEVGSVVSLAISNCNNEERCTLKRKTNASIEIGFISNVDTDVIKAVVYGVILDVPIPFSLPNPDGCVDSGLTCPISAGKTYNYKAVLPVLSSYPRVTVNVKWELKDKDDKIIICLLIPAQIK